MAIDTEFRSLWKKVFSHIDVSRKSVLISGVQEIYDTSFSGVPYSSEFRLKDWIIQRNGVPKEIDWCDKRADIIHDLNTPIPESMRSCFDIVIDIGTVEHVANSTMVFTNYMRALKIGGTLCLTTPVKGYWNHGFHTFSVEFIEKMISMNGLIIRWRRFTSIEGKALQQISSDTADVLLTVIAVKVKETGTPVKFPQQGRWCG